MGSEHSQSEASSLNECFVGGTLLFCVLLRLHLLCCGFVVLLLLVWEKKNRILQFSMELAEGGEGRGG